MAAAVVAALTPDELAKIKGKVVPDFQFLLDREGVDVNILEQLFAVGVD